MSEQMLWIYLGANHHALRYIWGSLYKNFGTRIVLLGEKKIKPTTAEHRGEVLYMSRFFCKNSFWVDGYVELGKFKKGTGLPFSDTSCVNISFVDWGKKKGLVEKPASYYKSQHCPLVSWGYVKSSGLIISLFKFPFVRDSPWEIDTRLFFLL